MATIKELSDKGPDGTRLGQSASDLIAFYGATPADQYAFTAAVSATPSGGVTQTSPFGFSSSLQLITFMTLVNNMQALLVEKGLMAAS